MHCFPEYRSQFVFTEAKHTRPWRCIQNTKRKKLASVTRQFKPKRKKSHPSREGVGEVEEGFEHNGDRHLYVVRVRYAAQFR